jgi:LacI family transcriptional regulator
VRRSGITVVSLAKRGLPLPVFSVDNEAVGAMLAEHALAHGHREIAIAAGPVNSHVTQERLRGSRRVLAQAGVKPAVVHGEFGVAGGVDAIDRLLADNPRLTMVLANADTLGVGILRGLAQRDLRVPDDVSVISAGNTAYARLCTPALTTMDIALAECCEAAVQYVSDNMGRADPAGEPTPFGPKLMPGLSVRTIAPELGRGRVRAI